MVYSLNILISHSFMWKIKILATFGKFCGFMIYCTCANKPPTVYFLFGFLAGDLFKRVIFSRGWSIKLANFETKTFDANFD